MNDKYTKQRKRLLEELDKGKDVSILELGMYDLTPYFDIDKFDVNLSEAIMLNKNFDVWKNIYEDFYGIPLEYTTKKENVVNEK